MHLQELSEYILLPDFSLKASSNFVCPSVLLSLKRAKIDFTRKTVEMITHLQFILRSLEIQFVFALICILSFYVLST